MSICAEDLIIEVQKRPCIWNVNVEEYYNKVRRQHVWYNLAQIMYKDWEHLKKDIKLKRVRTLKNKWKGLRTYYFREKTKNMSLGDGVKEKKRRTPLWDMLQFLSVVKRGVPKSQIKRNTIQLDTKERQDSSSSKAKEMPNFQQIFLQCIEKNRDDDPDRSFLLSLLPDMKSMDPSQNLNFRFEVMKIIKQIKYSENGIRVAIKHEPPSENEFCVETPEEFQS